MSPSTALPARGGAKLALLVVGLCWLVVLFDGLDMFIYGSVLPHMLETKALGIDPSKAGDVGSYATFGMLIGALSSGTVSDWVGRKKTIIVSTAVFSLASALCASANSPTPSASAASWRASASAACCRARSPWSPSTPRAAAAPWSSAP